VTIARGIAWAAFAWAIVSMALCFYIGIAWSAPFIAVSGAIGIMVVSMLVWLVYHHWVLISAPVAVFAIPLSGAGLNPAFVFAISCLLIVIASVIDFFKWPGAKLRANGGRA
jgi:hypothetical protein